MQRTRNMQAVGYTRKILPTQTIQQQAAITSQMLQPAQIQNSREIVGEPDVTLNGQLSGVKAEDSGTITIVIDKKELCNCSSANEDVQIHITTTPKASQTKRVIQALSEANVSQICSTKCGSCQVCEKDRRMRIQGIFPVEPNPKTFQQPNADAKFSDRFPRLQQNVYGMPLRNFDDVESSKMKTLSLKKNRSFSDFPKMRKMVVPERFDQIQPNIGQVKVQQSPPIHRHNYNQQRNMSPNLRQMPRRFSVDSQPSQPPKQQRSAAFEGIHQRPKSYPVNALGTEWNRQRKMFSSIDQNPVPLKRSLKDLDIKKTIQPQNEMEIGRPRTENDKRPPQQQDIGVIRPAMFSPTNALNEIVAMQNVKPVHVLTQKEKIAELFHGPFVRHPSLLNLQANATRNRFPKGRANVPRISLQNQQLVKRAYSDTVAKSVTQSGLRSPLTTPTRANILSSTHQPAMKHRSPLILPKIQQSKFSGPAMLLKKTSEVRPVVNQHEIKNRQQTPLSQSKERSPAMLTSHQTNYVSPKKQPLGIFGKKQKLVGAQQISLKNRLPEGRSKLPKMLTRERPVGSTSSPSIAPSPKIFTRQQTSNNRPALRQRTTSIMSASGITNLRQTNQPPRVLLKKKNPARTAINPGSQIKRQPSKIRNKSSIPVPRKRVLPQQNVNTRKNYAQKEVQEVISKVPYTATPPQASMIPVRKISPQTTSQQSPYRTNSSRKIPVLPFEHLVYPTQPQSKGVMNPKLHRINLVDAKKQRKFVTMDQRQRRIGVGKTTAEQRPSSLPVIVMNRPNQIQKYVQLPNMLQSVGRPEKSIMNQQRLNQRYGLSNVKDLCIPDLRSQQMPQLLQMNPKVLPRQFSAGLQTVPRMTSPINGQQNLPRDRLTTPSQAIQIAPPRNDQNTHELNEILPKV